MFWLGFIIGALLAGFLVWDCCEAHRIEDALWARFDRALERVTGKDPS